MKVFVKWPFGFWIWLQIDAVYSAGGCPPITWYQAASNGQCQTLCFCCWPEYPHRILWTQDSDHDCVKLMICDPRHQTGDRRWGICGYEQDATVTGILSEVPGVSSRHPVLLMWSWTWCLKRPGPASDPLTIDVAETNDTSRGLVLPLMLDVARTLMPQEGSVVTVFSDDWSLVLPWPVTRSSKDSVYIYSCSNSFEEFKKKGLGTLYESMYDLWPRLIVQLHLCWWPAIAILLVLAAEGLLACRGRVSQGQESHESRPGALIGQQWSRDLDTGLWLVSPERGISWQSWPACLDKGRIFC